MSPTPDTSAAIVIASTFTADMIQPSLAYWLNRLEIRLEIKLAPFDQLFQQLLSPDSEFAGNRDGINIALLRLEDWAPALQSKNREAAEPAAISMADQFVNAVSDGAGRAGTELIVCFCPAAISADDSAMISMLDRVESHIAEQLASCAGICVVRSQDLVSEHSEKIFRDAHAERLAGVPYTDLFFTTVGTRLARAVYGITRPEHKVLVLDCDDTLWGGICGELGANEVRVQSHHRVVQEFAVSQHQIGRLICLASRNNEADVMAVFREHPDMVLQERHLTASKINWELKSDNLAVLSRELGLGLDSFVFIDDDPLQIEEVRSRHPEVLALRAPESLDSAQRLLSHIWPFDARTATSEGARRTAAYRDHAKREQLRVETLTLEAFLESLELVVDIRELADTEIARATELSQRTNQFNLTGIRHTASQIKALCDDTQHRLFATRVKDRFGDYGLVGLMLCQLKAKVLEVPAFLLSCRALGRGVEHHMLRHLGALAVAESLEHVELIFNPTEKNTPAQSFVKNLKPDTWNDSLSRLQLEASEVSTFKPNYEAHAAVEENDDSTGASGSRSEQKTTAGRVETLIDAATRLSGSDQTHQEIHANDTATNDEPSEPGDPIRFMLAQAFSKLLGIKHIEDDAGFFELGGHSLQAVQVLAQASQEFDIELDPTLLFTTNFSIAELKEEIEHLCAARGSYKNVSGLLDQLSQMTD